MLGGIGTFNESGGWGGCLHIRIGEKCCNQLQIPQFPVELLCSRNSDVSSKSSKVFTLQVKSQAFTLFTKHSSHWARFMFLWRPFPFVSSLAETGGWFLFRWAHWCWSADWIGVSKLICCWDSQLQTSFVNDYFMFIRELSIPRLFPDLQLPSLVICRSAFVELVRSRRLSGATPLLFQTALQPAAQCSSLTYSLKSWEQLVVSMNPDFL